MATAQDANIEAPPAGLPCPDSTTAYWQRDPSGPLRGHRSTPDLPPAAAVVVVGSGITGAFAAHFILNHGHGHGHGEGGEGGDGGGSRGEGVAGDKTKKKKEGVVMLEAREACWGATARNGGHCQPLIYASEPDVSAFELENFAFLEDFVRDNAVDCDWRGLTGVHAFLTQDVADVVAVAVDWLRRKHPRLAAGVEFVTPASSSSPEDGQLTGGGEAAAAGGGGGGGGEKVGRKSKHTLASLRVPEAKAAVVHTKAASLWPYRLVAHVLASLLAAFPAPSFNLQTSTPVTGLVRGDGGGWVLHTPRGSIAADKVLLATNGYTSHLLPAMADLIVPVRGQAGALAPPTMPAVELEHAYVFLGNFVRGGRPATRNEYLVQRPPPAGELIFGGGRHLAKDLGLGKWRDDVVEEQVARHLRTELPPMLDLLPRPSGGGGGEEREGGPPNPAEGGETKERGKQELAAEFEWTGVMGYSRDSNPWVGPVPESAGGGEGLYICAGYTGHGMPAATLCAREVAAMMMASRGAARGPSGSSSSSEAGGMPGSYVISEDRVARARVEWDEMAVEQRKGLPAELARLRAMVELG